MSFRKILLSLAITFLSFTAFAQKSAIISGYIKDSTAVIPGASVVLKNTKTGTVSNTDGYYELTQIPPGNYVVIASYMGYISTTKQIALKSGQQLSLSFTLKKNFQELDNVAITGKTKSQELKESGFAVNTIDLKKFANTTADLNQVLNRTSGIKIREQGGMGSDFKFAMNGLSGKQVKFFLDGIPMETFGTAMSLNNIPVNLAERIEIYKGVVPVELGSDALGGAINIVTDQHTKKFLDASFSYGSFNTSRAALSGRYTADKTGLIFNFSGYHNYSDNDYLMRNNPKYGAPIQVNENGETVQKDAYRFHDAYKTTMGQFDVGVINKSWADQLTLGFIYSSLYKEIQTGASQNIVYGGVNNREHFFMPSLKYRKKDFLIKGLSLNTTASYSSTQYKVTDTASHKYGWGGIGAPELIAGEIGGVKTITRFKNNATTIRANFAYEIDAHQSLNLNYTYSHFARSSKEDIGKLQNNPFAVPNTITKNILGLAYQNNLLNNRLTITPFAKYYGYSAFVPDALSLGAGNGWTKEDSRINQNNFGYGIATRFKIIENAGIKASYENAYRLQEPDELFGDGITVAANSALKPEKSKNINAGLYYNYQHNAHRIAVEASYFYRDAKDFILMGVPSGKFTVYSNVGKTKIKGVEAEIRYSYSQLLEASVNASYENARNLGETQAGGPAINDRIPNQPWVYGNANIGIGKNDLIGKHSRLQFNWSTQYVHWFYLRWESLGSKESNNQIPSQLIHNASLSYSFMDGKYNISAESFNLTNVIAYDNFRLQKPGRSVFLKLRYFIK
ncbi:outer membrane receptor protein involved in Fe transport [Pedobacter cryoconitis]|uniref:TonB-dependent receptor n=1 Tax=Pedobacter cryoconitis TaxID=188932 RepID=UPI001619B683|nr:TonB-dependent receptor [Pedobacter cryoconitis]MBB6273085.1 outer membrane receptor protein involved in Fe transport [Pedobacter cryoconitis]